MARYRALADISLGSNWPYAQAGTILVDGPGGNIPDGWVPPGCVEPLDASAATAFWQAGVQLPGRVISQWTNQVVPPPLTKWVPIPDKPDPTGRVIPSGLYQLTGLGGGRQAQFFGAAPP